MENPKNTTHTTHRGALDFYQKLDYESSPSKFNDPADYEILSQQMPANKR
jgi:hypothetical protein